MKYPTGFRKSIFWGGTIIVLSIIDTGSVPGPNFTWFDKFVHFGFYLLLTFLIIYESERIGDDQGAGRRRWYSRGVIISILLGGLLEIVQLIPSLNRSCELADFLANTAGALSAAYIVYPLFRRIIPNNNEPGVTG